MVGDRLLFYYLTADSALLTKPITTGVIANVPTSGVEYTDIPSAFHSAVEPGAAAPPKMGGTMQKNIAFPTGYRGWSYIGYNGNRTWADEPIHQNVLYVDDTYTYQNARVYPFRSFPSQYESGQQNKDLFPTDGHYWIGSDDLCWIKKDIVSSSRLGVDYVWVPSSGAFAGGQAVSRLSMGNGVAIGGGASFASGSVSTGSSEGELDFMDLNGDRYPDVVGGSRVQYTQGNGSLESANRTVLGLGKIRESSNVSGNVGVGGNPAKSKPDAKGNNAPSGTKSAQTVSQRSSVSQTS